MGGAGIEQVDWGKIGIRDRKDFDTLDSNGHTWKQISWDYYSLDSADDLQSLNNVLLKHTDSKGCSPVFSSNFVLANPDFGRITASSFQTYHYIPL